MAVPIVELADVSKRFVKPLDLAGKIARALGADLREEVVHAVEEVALAVQMIFQDPMSSLNPRKRVRDIIGEAPRVHGLIAAAELDDYVGEEMSLEPRRADRESHRKRCAE